MHACVGCTLVRELDVSLETLPSAFDFHRLCVACPFLPELEPASDRGDQVT